MPYYHVLIVLAADQKKHKQVFENLSEDNLEEFFLKPYRLGNNFLSGGDVIYVNQIHKVCIVQTQNENAIERKAINKADLERIRILNYNSPVVFISAGRGYDPEDILESGVDVTAKYVGGPPGYQASKFSAKQFVNNGWVIGVITSIAVGLLLTWLLS